MARRLPNGNIGPDDIKRVSDHPVAGGGRSPRGTVVPEDVRSNKMIGNPPQPQRQPDRSVLDEAMSELKDVEVSEKVRRDSERQQMDDRMYQQLISPDSTDEQREDARAYLDDRREEILRRNEVDRAMRNADERTGTAEPHDAEPMQGGRSETLMRVAKGLGTTIGVMAGGARHSISEARKSQAGDIDVSAYDYTNRSGKRVHVKRHKRRRS